ncbi:MAG: hypothetical protein J3Q66DRAFT_362768 [Benniella sp.]|nr:MAG: hypothetical protein J3Q66DRAFT_362768 [Benniella sp.]
MTLQAVSIDAGLDEHIKKFQEYCIVQRRAPLFEQWTTAARSRQTFYGLHFYLSCPTDGPGALTTSRDNEMAKIKRRKAVNRLVGAALMKSGLEAAFLEFVSHHAIPGVTQWDMFADKYSKSDADRAIHLPFNETELALVEDIIGHPFSNKKLLEMALTVPNKARPPPDYNRLEYLGDAVMELVILEAWINKGSVVDAGTKTQDSACNLALQAVCVAAGLQGFIKRCDRTQKSMIRAVEAAYAALEPKSRNKAYWNQGPSCKILGDVMESIYAAVYLDSGLKLSAVEGVFKRIHWPIVEKRQVLHLWDKDTRSTWNSKHSALDFDFKNWINALCTDSAERIRPFLPWHRVRPSPLQRLKQCVEAAHLLNKFRQRGRPLDDFLDILQAPALNPRTWVPRILFCRTHVSRVLNAIKEEELSKFIALDKSTTVFVQRPAEPNGQPWVNIKFDTAEQCPTVKKYRFNDVSYNANEVESRKFSTAKIEHSEAEANDAESKGEKKQASQA